LEKTKEKVGAADVGLTHRANLVGKTITGPYAEIRPGEKKIRTKKESETHGGGKLKHPGTPLNLLARAPARGGTPKKKNSSVKGT